MVNTLVLISKEQRAHILSIDARHPGRVSERAIRLGFEFMHTPIRDFALFCYCLDGSLTREDGSMNRAEALQWDPEGEQVSVPLNDAALDVAVKHFTAIELEPRVGFSICLWYGLLAYHCKTRSLREMVWPHYPRRKDDPMSKILNDGKTYAGQAYLAGSSGGNYRCKTCTFYKPRKGKNGHELDGRCEKYSELMGNPKGPTFPSSALACKYHETCGCDDHKPLTEH